MKRLKVWGGRFLYRGKSERLLIAAYTKKQAMEISNTPSSEFNNYFCETGNSEELERAASVGTWLVKNQYTSDIGIVKFDAIHRVEIEERKPVNLLHTVFTLGMGMAMEAVTEGKIKKDSIKEMERLAEIWGYKVEDFDRYIEEEKIVV